MTPPAGTAVRPGPSTTAPKPGHDGRGFVNLVRAAFGPDLALVAGPALLAAVLCFYEITGRSLGFDEGASVAIASQHGGALWHAIAHDGGNMAGYYVLLHVLIGLFGNGELVLRLPSAVATGVTAALVSLIALRLFDRRVALASALLTSVSLPLVFWGQSARSYALLVALCAGSFLAFAVLVDGKRLRPAWIGYVLCTTLAVYASLMALLIIPAQLLVLTWHRRRAWHVAGALLAVAVFCIPLAVLAAQRGSGQLFWEPRPNLVGEKQVLEALTSAGLQPTINSTATTNVLLVLTTGMLLLIAGAILRNVKRRDNWAATLVLSWFVVPVALAWVESLLGQPIFVPRNLLMVVPAAALLLAWGLTRPRVPALLALSSFAALLALRALQLAPSYGVSPENWQAATAYVLAHAQSRDCLALYPSDGRQAFNYYLASSDRARAPRPVLPTAPFTQVRTYVEDYRVPSRVQLARLPTACARLWLVTSHAGLPHGPAGSRANYARYVALRVALLREFHRHSLKSFGYASPVVVLLAKP